MKTELIEVDFNEIATGSDASIEYDHEPESITGSPDPDDTGDISDSFDFGDFDFESLFSGPGSLADQEMDLYCQEYVESTIAFNAISPAAAGETNYINCIRLDCTINGDDCTVLFPPEYIDRIFIDEHGRLWNMSASTITGRIVDEEFDPYKTEGSLVYLTACLGNNFQSIYNNGSPNYVREYYWSSNRLTSTDRYTEIVVNDYHYPFFATDMWNYVIVFLLFFGVILSWLSNSRHY